MNGTDCIQLCNSRASDQALQCTPSGTKLEAMHPIRVRFNGNQRPKKSAPKGAVGRMPYPRAMARNQNA